MQKRVQMTVAHSDRNAKAQGAGTMWAYGYADIAEVTGIKPLELVELVVVGELDPLALLEVVGLARGGRAWLRERAAELHPLRVPPVVEPRSVVPSPLPAPQGLTSMWAWCYADLAAATLQSDKATWAAGHRRGFARARGLTHALDFVLERSPMLKDLRLVEAMA